MKVNVKGIGVISFPDTMTDLEVRTVLKQFEQKPTVVKETEIVKLELPHIVREPQVVEVPVIVREPQVIEVEKVIVKETKPKAWRFEIERDEFGISAIIARPLNGK